MTKVCTLPSCELPLHAKGLCKRHYQQQWSTGSAQVVRPNPHGTPEERFWAKVPARIAGECWEWSGRLDKDGYGQLRVGNTQRRAHRFSFELHNGSAAGIIVRHLCNNPSCVNPEHLAPGTHQDNMNDRRASGNYVSSTCRQGHEWTPENTVWQNRDKTKRTCRTCRQENNRREARP